ncbi:MAG: metal-binding protein [Clostridia bacterium]|nr:metal-binding protein [Clostridia bacterium]
MSCRFFENKKCEYYPCHKGVQKFNCLFCYCPLYLTDCGGNFTITNGVKDCSNCIVPHKAENYDYIINKLSQNKNRA